MGQEATKDKAEGCLSGGVVFFKSSTDRDGGYICILREMESKAGTHNEMVFSSPQILVFLFFFFLVLVGGEGGGMHSVFVYDCVEHHCYLVSRNNTPRIFYL